MIDTASWRRLLHVVSGTLVLCVNDLFRIIITTLSELGQGAGGVSDFRV